MSKAVDYFWSWFVEYNAKLKKLRSLSPKEQNHYSFWMKWHLHFYAPGLDYIIKYPQNADDKIKLIITAHGDPQYFEKVEEIVNEAPRLKDWEIAAFIQPYQNIDDIKNGLDKPYVFDDLTLKMSEIKYTPIPDPDINKIHLLIFIPDFDRYTDNADLIPIILLILQDLLGEKLFYKYIDCVDVDDITAEEEDCLLPLFNLQEYVDVIKD